ncbi:MAG: ParB/RepB/Spo0J family partition protein [Nitrospirae bacterium]|nr:ParB/RepB/Spo0J family partition protein [Nitrospirota bacterium]
MTKKMALGRGLGTLIPGAAATTGAKDNRESISELELTRIIPNKYQPRQFFEDTALSELADSIREHGVIQPIIVRHITDGAYELVAGERRWRAAQIAGLSKIPVVIKDLSNEKSLEIALIENLQRENLNPVESAQGYRRLTEEFGLTQEEIAARVGKERSTVTNYLRLLTLPVKIQEYLSRSVITTGHAKAILSFTNRNDQLRFADYIVKKGSSVRETELLAKRWGISKGKKKVVEPKDVAIRDVELRLQRMLGTKVTIQEEKKGGKIVVEYYSVDDLTRILEVVEKN